MNSKVKTFLGIILFIIFLGGTYFAYHSLSEKNKPDLLRPSQEENNLPDVPDPSQEEKKQPSPAGTQDKPSGITPAATNTPEETPSEEGASQGEEDDKLAAFDFSVYDAQGNEAKLSDFFGKPIIINFWTTWCPYCVEEMPVFEQAYQQYGDDIQFLMIDCVDGERETQEMGESFIQKKGFTFPVYYDTEGNASSTYQVYSLPTSVFIDRDGIIIVYYPGGLTAEMLQQGIDLVLADSGT